MSSELLLHGITAGSVQYFEALDDREGFLTVNFWDGKSSSVKMFFVTPEEARKIMQKVMDALDKYTNEEVA